MPFYDIAGLVVEIKHPTGRTEKQARPYLCKDQEGQTADITIDVTEQRVTDAMAEHPEMNRDDWYYMLTGSDFYTQLLKFRGILRGGGRRGLRFFRRQRHRQIHPHRPVAQALWQPSVYAQ